MPLPLAPILPLALRLGAVAATGYAATRWLRRRTYEGRTDQRAEDALDDLGEGLSLHRPADRVSSDGAGQTNAGLRVNRVVRFRGKSYEMDIGIIGRVRVRTKE
ncbi:hypothetical protein Q9295_02495 [Xinfangfangia sp. CPCC 101601]|uniref:DUF2845 domain-containing protein n=1 Tax=Pseudogemmobacter lacusdianii TaxID=3069608 RepID=A0ABU0VVF9_9RHOB|nr:hypothetical protein [Xinfangfangia sp. CPCC 101601]MDQ2065230.1 hypothetical protein [Xinfangfangia sp. CPCC 101601]